MPVRATEARPNRRRDQGGFVLLTLLFTAAAIAIQLAIALPRAAMEAQRIREEKLIYRGEQYKRAIELYYRKHQKYPQELDDLEDTNGVRYLRQRYKDPLSGEDEWRLIHMGPDGRFKDSIVYDTEDEEERLRGGSGSGSRSGTASGMGSGFGGGFGQSGVASRGSGGGQAGGYGGGYPQAGGFPGAGGFGQGYSQSQQGFVAPDGRFRGADRARAARQSTAPQILGQGGPFGGIPGQEGGPRAALDPNDPNAGQGTQDEAGAADQTPDYSTMLPSQIPAGTGQRQGYPQTGGFGAGTNRAGGRRSRGAQGRGGSGFGQSGGGGRRGGFGGQGAGGQTGQRPMGFGGQGAGGQAASVIGQLLTQPRPGGLAGLQGRQNRGGGGAAFTGGIAGVASKAEERGVKIYKEREVYNEWEFVFDYREAQGMGGGMGAMGGGGMPMQGGQPGLTSSRTMTRPPGGRVGMGGAVPAGYPTSGQPGGQASPGGSGYGQGTRRSPYARPSGGGAGGQPRTNRPFTRPRTTRRQTGNPFPGANQRQPGNRNLPPGLVPGSSGYGTQPVQRTDQPDSR